MVYRSQMRQVRFSGLDGSPPKDVVVLLAVVFVTYSLQFFTPVLMLLRLTEEAVFHAMVWQPFSYPFIGLARGGLRGAPVASIFILLELFILYVFAVDVFRMLGRRRFWRTLVVSTAAAAVIALLVNLLTRGLAPGAAFSAFSLMQGQRILIAVVIAAFAVLRGNATIMLFFVLPVKARLFIWIEIAFAFIGFLGTKDFAGFVGVCAAIGLTVWFVRHPSLKGGLRELRLRTEQRVLQRKLERTRRQSQLKVIRGEGASTKGVRSTGSEDPKSKKDDSPWIN